MKSLVWLAIVLMNSGAWCQQVKPSERLVDHFQVEGASRLAALAKLGAITNTTLLVEAGSVAFLQANASEASMWVVGPEPSLDGCIDNPASRWQVGLYGFGRGFTGCGTPFRESVGPSLVVDLVPRRDSKTECTGIQLPNPVPSLSPTHP
jgi:hypothetical protein